MLRSGNLRGERMLLWVLARGESEHRAEAIDLLGELGSARVIPPLVETAARRHRRRVADAITAIRERQGDRTVGGLSFESPEVRAALGKLSLDDRAGDLTLAP